MKELLLTKDAIEFWEDEGGALTPKECQSSEEMFAPSFPQGKKMTGTVNQVEWAEKIQARVSAEFDRRCPSVSVGGRQAGGAGSDGYPGRDREKRAEVMAKNQAGYFIHDWQEITDQVRQMIAQDSR